MRRALPTRSGPLAVVVVASLAGIVAACGGDPGPSASPSPDPSTGPVIEAAVSFCDALDVFEGEHETLREIRLRPNNRRALGDQYDQLDIAWDDIPGSAPIGLGDELDAMRWSVINLGIAIEDYTTTTKFDQAAEHVLEEDIVFDKTLADLRERTTCGEWTPTPAPSSSAGPSPSASPATSGSPAPAASAAPSASVPSTGPSAAPPSVAP
ncbi:MAG: hypothetical protein U0869_00595 [Chloroflexota bacterium]